MWLPRNKAKYDGIIIKAESVILKVTNLVFLTHKASPHDKALWKGDLRVAKLWNICFTPPVLKRTKIIYWEPPISGVFKVNTDGAIKASSSMASCGGIIKDHIGRIFLAYQAF